MNMGTLPHGNHTQLSSFYFGQIGNLRAGVCTRWHASIEHEMPYGPWLVACQIWSKKNHISNSNHILFVRCVFLWFPLLCFCVFPTTGPFSFCSSRISLAWTNVIRAAMPDPDESDSCRYIILSDMFCRQLSTFAIRPDVVLLLLSPPSSNHDTTEKVDHGIGHWIMPYSKHIERVSAYSSYVHVLFTAHSLLYLFLSNSNCDTNKCMRASASICICTQWQQLTIREPMIVVENADQIRTNSIQCERKWRMLAR